MRRKCYSATSVVEYYAGPYNGTRQVEAEDSEHAIAKVRAWVQQSMTMSPYASGYEVLKAEPLIEVEA